MENQKIHIHLQCSKKQRVLTVLYRTIKSKKLWQQQIGQLLQEEKNGTVVTFPLLSKWTYKTAVAIANESTDTSMFEIICVVETNKIMIKNDKKEEEKSNI